MSIYTNVSYKKCKCKLCDCEPFNSVTEGKRHIIVVHKKSYSNSRKYLELVK